MDYEQIRDALKERELSITTAAEAMGRSRTMLTLVAQRKEISRPVALSLAVLLERSVEVVFPDVPEYHGESVKEVRERRVAEAREKLIQAGLAEPEGMNDMKKAA